MYLQEEYLMQSVDLISGLGGALGLWLGWSVMTLGDIIAHVISTLKTLSVMK